jgi:hypothetical protein
MVDDFTTDWFFWHLADLLWSWSSSKQGCCKKGRVLQSNLGHFSSRSGVPFIARFYTCGSNKLKLPWEKLVDRQSCKLHLVHCSRDFILFCFIFVGGQICDIIISQNNFHTKIIVISLTIGIKNSQFFLNFCPKKNKDFQKEKTLVPRHYHKEHI